MITKIRESFYTKVLSILLGLNLMTEFLSINNSYALTGGPSQPEFNTFTPIGTSDMVDLASGDFSYNLPLLDIGGFPINLSYSSGVSMDQEASMVGLGWNLNIGQISRNVRGIPDDFKGDEMVYQNNLKDNLTVGASFSISPGVMGVEANDQGTLDTVFQPGSINPGINVEYNSYNGVSISPSIGMTFDLAESSSWGFNISSTPQGLAINPSISLSDKDKKNKKRESDLGLNFGVSFNSRQGLSTINMSASRDKGAKDRKYLKRYQRNAGESDNKMRDGNSVGSSISFVDNAYSPTIDQKMKNYSFTFNGGLGSEIFGGEAEGEVTAYASIQSLAPSEKNKTMQAYGYAYQHNATEQDVTDFNREKETGYSVNMTNLPLTNNTYDIYNISGQGVAGMFRPFRSQITYLRDNKVVNFGGSASLGVEFGAGNLVHAGVDIEVAPTYSSSGEWKNSNKLYDFFEPDTEMNKPTDEFIYYKNVGHLSVDPEFDQFVNEIHSYAPIRAQLGGSLFNRTASGKWEEKSIVSPSLFNIHNVNNAIKRDQRLPRNQNILALTKAQATKYGFNTEIHPQAENHHIAEYQITRNDGARYIYGKAAYNTYKKEVSFSMAGVTSNDIQCDEGTVIYSGSDNSVNNDRGDKYYNSVEIPPYAHSYLLTSIISDDYSDVDNIPGLSDGDYGSWTKISYANETNYDWRVPYKGNRANYNEGLKSDKNDEKASYVYGQKELVYVDKIETKTHIAVFHYAPRKDARGVTTEDGGLVPGTAAGSSPSMLKITEIKLYAKPEYIANPTSATPIKTVHFKYDYELCVDVPNNDGSSPDTYELDNQGGKLTLQSVYFTYRDSKMGKYMPYKFNYSEHNPEYNLKGYDIWGNYKQNSTDCSITGDLSNPEFNYVDQENIQDTHEWAEAWSLVEIELPSGGKINVEYEADDYQYVQNKKAMQMFKVHGTGNNITPSGPFDADNAILFDNGINKDYKKYLYIKLDESMTNQEFKNTCLNPMKGKQMYFRFLLNMTKQGGKANNWTAENFDYVTGYCQIDQDLVESDQFDVTQIGQDHYASVPIKFVAMQGGLNLQSGGVHPISVAGWHFGRKYLSNLVYGISGVNNTQDVAGIIAQLTGAQIISNLIEFFQGPNGALRDKLSSRRFIPGKSWIRLPMTGDRKYGGGSRVKRITMSDEWNDILGQPSNNDLKKVYGQEYDYDLVDGQGSSGVATYEPVGSKENPLVQPYFVSENRLLAPDENNFIEGPFGESFFPSPQVTYRQVTVKNLTRTKTDGGIDYVVKRNATGRVLHEFYTSKDYPTITDQTEIGAEEDKTGPLGNILNLFSRKHLTTTQGYTIHKNDMNGKVKAKWVFAEDQTTPISGEKYMYREFNSSNPSPTPYNAISDNQGKLNNTVPVINPNGTVEEKKIGVEFDMWVDIRQNKSSTEVVGVNTNVATFLVGPIPGIIPLPLPDYAHHEDRFRSICATKVINSFGVLEETFKYSDGASVSTKNLAWDAVTGEVLLTKTKNEYNDIYYSMNYPAYWYYNGMGPAFENTGNSWAINSSGSGIFTLGLGAFNEDDYFAVGDEVHLEAIGSSPVPSSPKAWVSSVSPTSINLIDENGNDVNLNGSYTVFTYRSGQRNLQSQKMMTITSMTNPIENNNDIIPTTFVASNAVDKIISASAIEYENEWPLQCECEFPDPDTFNPFRYNVKGVWRANKSHAYLTGRTANATPHPRNQGYFTSFSPFYQLQSSGGEWSIQPSNWTYASEVTAYSPFGFEIENKDALDRYSSAQYGYNNIYPLAVGSNTKYSELGYDGFEDYNFDGCDSDTHFGYKYEVNAGNAAISNQHAHTGRNSIRVTAGSKVTMTKRIGECPPGH